MSLQIEAVILAGGMARRMGGHDKGLVDFDGQPMIQCTLDRIRPQVDSILINANRNQAQYQQFGYPVLSDIDTGYLGPLAGMITAMHHTQAQLLLTVPCDCPQLPLDLAARMYSVMQQQGCEIVVASDGKREQPVIMLLKPELVSSMQAFLDGGERKIDFWYIKHNYAVCDFSDVDNAFTNVNTPEQKQQLIQLINS